MPVQPALPILVGPVAIGVFTLAVNGIVAALAFRERRGKLGEGDLGRMPGIGVMGCGALVALVGGAAGGAALFTPGERLTPVLAGLVLGLILGFVWEWAFGPPQEARPDAGALASGLATMAGLGMVFTTPVSLANALLGLLGGWGLMRLWALAVGGQARGGLDLACAALVAGAAAWGERLNEGTGLGLALALGTWLVLAWQVGGLAGRAEHSRRVVVTTASFYTLGALGIAGGLFGQPTPMLQGLAVGALLGALVPWLRSSQLDLAPLGNLALLVAGGGVIVLENRLMGVMAIGLGGLGLAVGARALPATRTLLALVVAIVAARVWLQLFLDRTMLTGYGVDLTHPYAFAALIVGGLVPVAAVIGGRLCRGDTGLTVGWGLAFAVLPIWMGYFWHIEALGAFLAGLILAAFGAGVLGEPSAAERGETLTPCSLTPPVLVLSLATTMLAAPWLVGVMNASRTDRLWVMGVGLAVVGGVMIYFWWRQFPRLVATAP